MLTEGCRVLLQFLRGLHALILGYNCWDFCAIALMQNASNKKTVETLAFMEIVKLPDDKYQHLAYKYRLDSFGSRLDLVFHQTALIHVKTLVFTQLYTLGQKKKD